MKKISKFLKIYQKTFYFSLLAQNQVSDFHSEIERLTYDEMQNDLYIKHPIKIEQYLMEGNYNKVWLENPLFSQKILAIFGQIEYSVRIVQLFYRNFASDCKNRDRVMPRKSIQGHVNYWSSKTSSSFVSKRITGKFFNNFLPKRVLRILVKIETGISTGKRSASHVKKQKTVFQQKKLQKWCSTTLAN